MGVIVDLYPVLPRRMYLARSQLGETGRLQGGRRRSASMTSNAPLGCLTGGALASRFHAWHGKSGRRYICSVYPVDPHSPSAGLPELDGAVVIGAAIDVRRERSRLVVFETCWSEGGLSRGSEGLEAALAAGAREWHVHLLATSAASRHAVILDLQFE